LHQNFESDFSLSDFKKIGLDWFLLAMFHLPPDGRKTVKWALRNNVRGCVLDSPISAQGLL
jgi:hypothetical protein